MPKIDETVIGFAVYEDATEYIGISEVTLPEISNITEEISGAGIGGKIESVILGAIEAMSLKSKEAFNRVLETVTAWTSITKRMFKFKFAFKSDNL